MFYNNLDSSANDQNQGGEKTGDDVPVLIFGVDPIWTIAGFLSEKISEIGLKEKGHT